MRNPIDSRGVSIIEVIVVVAILSVIATALVLFFSSNVPIFQRTRIRHQVMQDSRIVMDTVLERLRNGKARTLKISTPTTLPIIPNSRVDFALQTPLPSGATALAIYLQSNDVYVEESPPGPSSRRVLASNVTSLMFTGDSSDPGLVSVSLRVDAPLDDSRDPSHLSTLILPNHTVHMVESP